MSEPPPAAEPPPDPEPSAGPPTATEVPHVAAPSGVAEVPHVAAAPSAAAVDVLPATPALAAIAAAGIPHRVVRTERASSAEESARFQGIETRQLLRTIVVRRGEDDYLFVLVPAGRRFDWPKLRELLGVRRMTLPDADEARAATGYERYTITPFGSTRAWPVIADAAIVGEPVVAIGGGGFGINLHLAPGDLIAVLRATVADVSSPEAAAD